MPAAAACGRQEEVADAAAAARAAGAVAAVGASAGTSAGASAVSPELRQVDAIFERLQNTRGAGSTAAKTALLRELFARATAEEQDFLARLLFGELRQGALEGVLVEAVARAARSAGAATIRRAAMMAGKLAPVARAALVEGEAALARFIVQLCARCSRCWRTRRRIVDEALRRLGERGARIQARWRAHPGAQGGRRRPRLLARPERRDGRGARGRRAVRALPARELILDGEVIALRPDGTPHPFQITMRRFGRRLDVERAACGAAADAVLLRLLCSRRPVTARRAALAPRSARSPDSRREPRRPTHRDADARGTRRRFCDEALRAATKA